MFQLQLYLTVKKKDWKVWQMQNLTPWQYPKKTKSKELSVFVSAENNEDVP